MTEAMTEARGAVPDWSQGWRLRRALAHAEMTTEMVADELGVPRSAVSRWCNDHTRPSRGYLKLIAMRCGVSYDWLSTGHEDGPARGGDGAYGVEGLPFAMFDHMGEHLKLPRKDSNLQPAGYVEQDRRLGGARILRMATPLHQLRDLVPIVVHPALRTASGGRTQP